jgi:hypothetical protein
MLDLLEQSFPNFFWANVIIVINHLQQDAKSINRRRTNGRSDAQLRSMIFDYLRERYNLVEDFSLPSFFIDCKFDNKNKEEKTAFNVSFDNTLISARLKWPYYLQCVTAVTPFDDKMKRFEELDERIKLQQEKRDIQR